MNDFVQLYGQAAKTAVGFFWKAGWAFILGYVISSMIQVFVPKARLTRHMGDLNAKTIGLSTLFGTVSSSCSFAALAAARSLLIKGAHFIAVVAFMFASTNLVIELGILIYIFLGWQFVVSEIIGGLLLILISSILIKMTYPTKWIEQAREKASEHVRQQEDFDPWQKIKSKQGWIMVCRKFVMEWKMAWKDILIGFTIAGFMAVFIPDSFWKTLFLAGYEQTGFQGFLIALENAMIAPFVAASTFIGSMGNIPLATVLSGGGVLFAGVIGFIYSDLMVPPLVHINSKYYGWRIALYIALMMYLSIVITSLILNYSFKWLGLIPETQKTVSQTVQFKIDYTFFFNIIFALIAALMTGVWFLTREDSDSKPSKNTSFRFIVAWLFLIILAGGLLCYFIT